MSAVRIRGGDEDDVPTVLAVLDTATAWPRQIACERGTPPVPVDCYAGGDGPLVRYYEREGFTRTDAFALPRADRQWPGQELEQRL
jgi:hypothetical protein